MDTVLQDIRYGFRILLKSPGFTMIAVLTLALGIGANAAIFSVVNAVLLRPLPFPQSDRLISVGEKSSQLPVGIENFLSVSYPNFFDWRTRSRSFDKMASYHDTDATLTGGTTAAHLHGEVVSGYFFSVLGARFSVGDGFTRDGESVRSVVLSHALWQSALAADPTIIGKGITLNGLRYTVTGVTSPGFQFPIDSPGTDFWKTIADDAAAGPGEQPITAQRSAHFLQVVGRLKSGTTLGQARAEMEVISAALAKQYPESNTRQGTAVLAPVVEHLAGEVRPALLLLLGAVGCVLLIACANIANLMLARATKRSKEIAIRAALGADRLRLIRQLLTESLLLAVTGGALGLALSSLGLKLLLRISPQDIPRLAEVGLDGRVLAFTFFLSIATGVIFGLVPALHSAKLNLGNSLNERSEGGSIRHNRIRALLIIGETAVGLVLLVGAGLLIRSLRGLLHTEPGFDSHNILTFKVDVPDNRYPYAASVRFHRELLERIESLPGVASASAVLPLPLSDSHYGVSFQITGHPLPAQERPSESFRAITPGYLKTMRISLNAGRDFTFRDDEKSRGVIIINQAFANKYFPGENPLGKYMKPDFSITGDAQEREIIGVVANIKDRSLSADFKPEYYVPLAQGMISSATICVRTEGEPASLTSPIRNILSGLDKEVPAFDARTMDDYVAASTGRSRFDTLLLTLFAVVALILTTIGLYGVMAYTVVQRTREIGIRVALGASEHDILRMVLRQGLIITALGLIAGLAGAFTITGVLARFLYHVEPIDPITYLGVSALLGTVSFLAIYIPASRAAGVDPMVALRYE